MSTVSPTLPPGCPNEGTLENFQLGRLSDAEIDAVAEHLSHCPPCEERAASLEARLDSHPLLQQIRECVNSGSALTSMLPRDEPSAGAGDTAAESADGTDDSFELGDAQQFGPYVLRRLLGEGSMGVVYEAFDPRLECTFAVKMLHDASVPLAQERFQREAQGIARLAHDHVVRVFKADTLGDVPYFVMEYVPGGTLQARLKQGPVAARQAAEWARQLALALQHAHQRQVLHRDVKPSNILLTRDGRVKLADFGLTRLLDADERLTQSHLVLGTAAYMAPEQAAGDRDVGAAADQFGLGVVLYEMLAGQRPFRGRTEHETRMKVLAARPAPPSHLRRVPAELEAICLKALAAQPAARYASAGEMAEDLARWLRGERTVARPAALWRRALRRVGANSAAAILVGVLALLLMLAALPGPDAKLQAHWQAMAAGQRLELIGASGEPAWTRWVSGENLTQHSLADDGAFSLHTWGLCLLDLLPEVKWDHYRIRAKIKHAKTERNGCVGIYFARTGPAGVAPSPQQFGLFSYNDVNFQEKNKIWRPGAEEMSPRKMTQAFFTHRAYADVERQPAEFSQIEADHKFNLMPSGGTKVRDVEIRVDHGVIEARLDGDIVEGWGKDQWDARTAETHVQQPQPAGPRPRPQMNPRGAVGLYLERGSAAFQDFTIEPIQAES